MNVLVNVDVLAVDLAYRYIFESKRSQLNEQLILTLNFEVVRLILTEDLKEPYDQIYSLMILIDNEWL